MPTIFTQIMNGDLPGHIVWSDDVCMAFLTIAPLKPGHTLVVPREEVDAWFAGKAFPFSKHDPELGWLLRDARFVVM